MKREDGRKYFYQWELNQRLIVTEDCTIVQFGNGTLTNALGCEVKEENGIRYADVPNILLQTAADLHAFAWNEKTTSVVGCGTFSVVPMPKPAQYAYTQTEVKRYDVLWDALILAQDQNQVISEEVNGIRKGFDGAIYETAGEAVRGQVGGLNSYIEGVLYSRNLLPVDYFDGDREVSNGITYEKQEDGTVIANGTATNTSRYFFVKGMPIKAGTYTLSGLPAEGSTTKRFLMYVLDDWANTGVYFSSGSKTFTVATDTLIWVYIQYEKGSAAAENQVWKPMLEEGTVAHKFSTNKTVLGDIQKSVSQHTQQITSIVSDIHEIEGETDKLNYELGGVVFESNNLLPVDYKDGDYKEHYGITYEKQADGTVIATGTATGTSRYFFANGMPIKAGTYTLSGLPNDNNIANRYLVYILHDWANSGVYCNTGSKTFTLNEDTLIWVYIQYELGSATAENQVWKPMLEEGSLAHSYMRPGNTFEAIKNTLSQHTRYIAEIQTILEENSTDLPDYYADYMAEKIQAINSKDCLIGGHGDSFVFITDTHLERNNMKSPALIKEIVNNTAVRFVINGGDTLDDDPTQDGALARFRQWRKLMQGVEEYRVMGNHDLNGSGQKVTEAVLTEDQWYGTMVKPFEHLVNTGGKPYFCIDNQSQKIRYLCLSFRYNAELRAWLKARLTELEAGWSVLVIPHYLFGETTDTMHTNGQYLINDINEVYDSMKATLIGVLAGHTHVDYSTTEPTKGYHLIATTSDSRDATPGKTAGTTTEQAFDVIHIDTAAQVLYATRIGAGEDREWSY